MFEIRTTCRVNHPLVALWSAAAWAMLLPGAVYSQPTSDGRDAASAIDERIAKEQATFQNRFALMPHKPSYILPLSYNNHVNQAPFADLEGEVEPLEIKFQISLKFPLKRNLFGDNGHLTFGYTQASFWQAYNPEISSPFRETDHEPELMLSFFNDYPVLGMRSRIVTFGIVHQSNGQSGDRSRSWNRAYASMVFERDRWALSVRPWYRLPENADDDDNPDIERYLGHAELVAAYRRADRVLDLMLRHNAASAKGAVAIGWSFPINERVSGYVQYFNGYGESLIDYNASVNRIGVGILLANWL